MHAPGDGWNSRRYHLAGIAGVGMRALAEALRDAGAAISGSDRLWDAGEPLEAVARLIRQGVRITAQDGSGIESACDALVVSTAVEADNPECRAARRLGCPILHRAEVLAALVADRPLIAVAGTCGKSTTTAMLGTILAAAGFDPGVVNGAEVVAWQTPERSGSVRRGHGPWTLVEVDESDRSLLRFHPAHAILTNASADHFPLPETLALFTAFRHQVRGHLVDGILNDATPPPIIPRPWGSQWLWEDQVYRLPLPGAHNAINAWQAARMARALGVDAAQAAEALAGFGGVCRRLERVGVRRDGVPVVDDYAHNTEKLRAVWTTLAAEHPRILALWRPHGYGPLRSMMDALVELFQSICRPDDRLCVLPVYDAGGTADRSVNGDQLVARLVQAGVPAVWLTDPSLALQHLDAQARRGDVLAVLGARDPELPRMARHLVAMRS